MTRAMGGAALSSALIRQDVLPLAVGYALLIGLSLPVFAAATWLAERRRPNGNDP